MSLPCRTEVEELLLTVELNGDTAVILPSHHTGDLELIIHHVQQRRLRVAGVPPGCVTLFPYVPLEKSELFDVCLLYARASSEKERMDIRQRLYERPYPLFRTTTAVENLPVLYHPADHLLKLMHFICAARTATDAVFAHLLRGNAYLRLEPMRAVCVELRYLLGGSHAESPPQNLQLQVDLASQHVFSAPDATAEGLERRFEPAPAIFTRSDGPAGDGDENSRHSTDLTGEEAVDAVTSAKAEYLSEKDYALADPKEVEYYDEDGKLVAVYLKNAIPSEVCANAAGVLKPAATPKNMRAKTNGGQPPDTGIVGFYDYLNNPTQYKCRETQYMRQHGAEIEFGCKNLMQRLDSLYKAYAPKYHQLQEEAIAPEFRMYETVFSTITVNHNFRTAVHVDKGDFRSGLAALVVIGGAFSGCDLAVKKMKKRFPLRTGDVLFFDTSLEHGNTEVHDPEQGWERISVVCYYRTGLSSQTCQTERRRYLNRYLDGRLRQGGFTDVVNINEGDSRLAPLYVPWRLRERLASVQLAALNFASERLSKNTGSIIALTMGLGKTLVALTLCFSFLQQNPDKDILIVAPKQVIAHWRDEYEKWRSLGLFFRYFIASDGSQSQRQFFEESLNRYKMKMLTETHTEGYVFVLNSEYLQSFTSRFDKFRPSLIIVDEGHMMASKSGKLTDLLDQFGGLHVALTGTPLQNETEDLYRLVCWVNKTVRQTFSPQAFQKHSAFITQYITGKHSNLDAAARAQKILLEWMSTYVFREMEAELPPRYDYIIVCNNSVQQAKLLERIGATGETVTAATEHRPSLLTAHPICYVSYMMGRFNTDAVKREREEKKSPEEWKNLSDDRETTLEWRNSVAAGLVEPFVHASGKMTALVEIVRHAVALDQKVIIFSHYIATQDTILRVLLALKVKTLSMRSRDTYDRRQSVIDKFKATDSEHISVMVLSTKLAAFGLDFSMANHVVLFDSWWNPQVDSQAIARSYRRNQEHEVVVYRLATLPTDRSILRTQARKNALFNCIMREQEIQQTSHDSLENCEETEPDEGRKRLWSKLKNDIVLQGNTDKAVSAVYRC